MKIRSLVPFSFFNDALEVGQELFTGLFRDRCLYAVIVQLFLDYGRCQASLGEPLRLPFYLLTGHVEAELPGKARSELLKRGLSCVHLAPIGPL